jgi:transcriptional regulator with XRE-family HTH domain
MEFDGNKIRQLRQRLGWSLAEMGRRLGCGCAQIKEWEAGLSQPEPETLNQLRYLQDHVESCNDRVAQKPRVEKEMEDRRMVQLTYRDLEKDT